MENILISPPVGIQNTYIALTRVGNANFLYNLSGHHKMCQLSGAGTSIDKDMAEQFSKYEAIERIANSINCKKVIVETARNIGNKAVDMNKFPKLSSHAHSMNINFSLNQTYNWVECIDLYTQEKKMIPTSFVYLFQDKFFYGDRMMSPISTGAALHEDYISAIINGIYEVIERDSIALTWLLKTVKGEVSHLFSEEEKKVFDSPFLGDVKFYDTSTVDGITTICAHAKSNYSENCKNVLMFCSSINISDIKKKLWKELISVMYSFYTNEYQYDLSTDYSNFVRVDQGGAYMAKSFNDSYFDFFLNVPEIEVVYQETSELTKEEELKHLVNILKKEEFTTYVADISCREVLENNYKAVKVVIPEAQPISFVYGSRYLDSNRFVRLAKNRYGNNYKEHINNMPLAFS